MFPELDKLFLEIRAVRDCASVRRLCLDAWNEAIQKGEAEGLAFGRVLLAGVRVYREHEDRIHRRREGPAGH